MVVYSWRTTLDNLAIFDLRAFFFVNLHENIFDWFRLKLFFDFFIEKYLSKINVNIPPEIAHMVAVLAADTKRHAQEMTVALLEEKKAQSK